MKTVTRLRVAFFEALSQAVAAQMNQSDALSLCLRGHMPPERAAKVCEDTQAAWGRVARVLDVMVEDQATPHLDELLERLKGLEFNDQGLAHRLNIAWRGRHDD